MARGDLVDLGVPHGGSSSQHRTNTCFGNHPGIAKESLAIIMPLEQFRSNNLEVNCLQCSRFSQFYLVPRTKRSHRRLICSVATPLPTQPQESKMETPKEIFLKDYKKPDYLFDSVDLKFSLGEEKTNVYSRITVFPRVEGISSPLVLDGEDLKLLSIKVNGTELKKDNFDLDVHYLTLRSPPVGPFTMEIVTEIYPHNNTSLEGLYKSSGNFCTQCEAEGFRKITFYQDRPDVMAKYTCWIEADKALYPVLLSNGNLTEQGDLEDGKHFALWEDPFKKPCYLFALVAGQLESRDDTFVTCSGRKVSLRIWTPAEDLPKTNHAMDSLKAAMKWDEELISHWASVFPVVLVSNAFNTIFNSRLVLASAETATDADYAAILGVIGHEYFHNWTGNRVTCRDWFQLSLKEGLTVFRDQEFSSDLGSRAVQRIADVSVLRNVQFPQDAGPMAHSVRPESYIKVYEKGAEVVRMYKTLLGKSGFRKDANNADLSNFLLWYSQAGTPHVKVTSSYNSEARTYSLRFSSDPKVKIKVIIQEVPPTPGQPMKEPMFIPMAVGLLNSYGKDMPLSVVYHDGLLETVSSVDQPLSTIVLKIKKKEEEFVFSNILERPVPSLLRGFSAPVRLDSDLTEDDLFFLLANDSDEFNRWEAGQVLARKLMLTLVADFQQMKPLVLNPKFVDGIKSTLSNSALDKEFIAKAIILPGEGEIMDLMDVADPDAVHSVRTFIRKQLALQLKSEFLNTGNDPVKCNSSSEPYVFNHHSMARRALKSTSLAYLTLLEEREITELALDEYRAATNMTEQFAALAAIAQTPGEVRDEVLSDFYKKWEHDYLLFASTSMSDPIGGATIWSFALAIN
ncbi:hypothetical protein ACLOJK_015496 [Asimina triloba]